ncbi:EcsC family protein [Streptomyces sp. NPDC006798]|uniref:EcsC family protein n=1 Tax=Streptomyces sp. NPDC006798 TaxID=3155462 RepID=UPI003403159A
MISGGQLATAVSAGAAAAPSGGAIVGACAADTAVVLGLASRCVGHVSLFYGYDPEEPAEKLFVMSVVNAGTATSATAKTAGWLIYPGLPRRSSGVSHGTPLTKRSSPSSPYGSRMCSASA